MNACEAEERCLRIAYEIELMWGSGKTDLGRLKAIATGEKCGGHDTATTGNSAQLIG